MDAHTKDCDCLLLRSHRVLQHGGLGSATEGTKGDASPEATGCCSAPMPNQCIKLPGPRSDPQLLSWQSAGEVLVPCGGLLLSTVSQRPQEDHQPNQGSQAVRNRRAAATWTCKAHFIFTKPLFALFSPHLHTCTLKCSRMSVQPVSAHNHGDMICLSTFVSVKLCMRTHVPIYVRIYIGFCLKIKMITLQTRMIEAGQLWRKLHFTDSPLLTKRDRKLPRMMAG